MLRSALCTQSADFVILTKALCMLMQTLYIYIYTHTHTWYMYNGVLSVYINICTYVNNKEFPTYVHNFFIFIFKLETLYCLHVHHARYTKYQNTYI